MSEFKEGDRVRLVVEATLTPSAIRNDGVYYHEDGSSGPWFIPTSVVKSIEKIEPPVEVFKVGDTVRSKGLDFIFTVGRGGYLDHENGIWNARPGQKFDSRYYEKVTLP